MPSTAAPSKMLIDATQFIAGTDMCGAITAAYAQLGSGGYPAGATIDARGFTGIQVCAASNITTMLSGCIGGSGHNGGKLLLGSVNLYADGPASGNYTDGHGSVAGTPALIIPSKFWGIEGVSRGGDGSATAGPGTFLSVCTGAGTPISGPNGCQHAFPVRKFTIVSTSLSTVGGIPTMTITLPDPVTSGTTIYPDELAMVKGNSILNENGTFKIQSITNSSGMGTTGTITVTGSFGSPPACSVPPSSCGTLFLGTPILGFGPGGGFAYNAQNCPPTNGCNAFGEHFKILGFNCQDQDGCIGWQNLYAEEESGVDTFQITQYNFVGFDTHGAFAQNFGPVLNAEILTGASNANCDFGTTGAYIGDRYMHGFDSWTIGSPDQSLTPSPCGNTPIAAVLLDAPDTLVSNGHCETFSNCVLVGANNNPSNGTTGERVRGIVGPPSSKSGINVVQISGNYPSNTSFTIENIRNQGGTPAPNTILDGIKNITITDAVVGLYAWDTNGSLTNLLTTDTSIRNRFDAGVQAKNLVSGSSTPTDIAGRIALSGGSATQSLTGSYTSPPNCGCWDVTTPANACSVSEGTTTLTFSGHTTDTVKYICIGRN